MIKKMNITIIIILLMTILTGCWDNRSLTDLGLVLAMGIDKKGDSYEVSYQVVKPGTIKGKQGGGSGQEQAYWTYTSSGETVFDAVRNALKTTNKKLYLNYTQIVVIGESLAREGIKDVLDFLERDPEFGRDSYMIVVKGGEAKEIIDAESNQEDIPAMHISNILENNRVLGKMKDVAIIDVYKKMNKEYSELIVGKIEKINSEKEKLTIKDLKVEGSAVFIKDKLVGWLGVEETRGLLFIENKINNTLLVVQNPIKENKKVSIEIKKSETKININFKDKKPVFVIEVNARGNIAGQQGKGDLTEDRTLKKLQGKIKEEIKSEIKSAINKSMNVYNSDFLDFSGVINRKDFTQWNKLKEKWDSIFPDIEVRVEVKFNIIQSGLIRERTMVR
ncbi:MAG: Ger(x)C family spore germination protein [Halanaerobiaceae bacterium]